MREKEESESLGDVEGIYASPLIHCCEGFITNSLFNKVNFHASKGKRTSAMSALGALREKTTALLYPF